MALKKSQKRELNLNADATAELESKIQELALLDFEAFCKMFSIDKTKAYVCFEIKKKKSLQQIGLKLGVGRNAVWAVAQTCDDKTKTTSKNTARK